MKWKKRLRLEEENSLQKEEISKLKEENECLRIKPLVCDILCDTSDLCERFEGSLDKECKVEDNKYIGSVKFANIASCFNDNVGLKIMKKIGYKGEGFSKHGQGIQEPIESIVRTKYEGLEPIESIVRTKYEGLGYRGKGNKEGKIWSWRG